MPLLRFEGVLLRSLLRSAQGAPPVPRLSAAIRLAALTREAAGARFARFALGVELVSPAASARLNVARRGRAGASRGPTDVLSYASLLGNGALPERGSPAHAAHAAAAAASGEGAADAIACASADAGANATEIEDLGDIVLCPAVLARDAARAGARLEDHWRAVLVHGLVHLLGHDHEPDGVGVDLVADAAALMGRRERDVAARLAELEREAGEPLRLFDDA